ncbi:MAG: site-specific integrase [Elusimicrobiota bacterium]|jgi:integrase
MATLWRAFVPQALRPHFGGHTRLARRFTDPKVGAAWKAKVEAEIRMLEAGAERESIGIAPAAPELTIEQASSVWLDQLSCRAVTERGYRQWMSQVCRLLGAAPMMSCDASAWAGYLRDRRETGTSDDALARERLVLQMCARWTQAAGYQVNPYLLILPKIRPLPVIVRRFDPGSVEEAIAQLRGLDRIVAELAIGTGMRAAEIRHAQVEWIRLDQGIVGIPHCRDYSPKGARPRVIPLSDDLVALLREWIGDRTTGPLIQPRYHHRGSGLIALRHVVARLKEAGVVRNGLHDLRHHYLSQLAADGAKGREIQEVAGHAQSRTTDLYTHASPGYLESVRAAVNRRRSGSDRGSGPAKWIPRLVALVV